MHDQEHVEGVGEVGIDVVFLAWHREHHVEEVFAVVEVVAGIHQRLAARLLVAVGGDGRQLGEQPVHAYLHLPRVADVERVLVERGECPDHAARDRHRMGVAGKAPIEAPHVLVDHRVVRERLPEGVELRRARKFAFDQQVGDLDEVTSLGQHLDRVATVAEDSLLAIEERDRARRRSGVDEALVEGDQPRLGPQFGDVDRPFPFGAHDHGQVAAAAVELQRGGAVSLGARPRRGRRGCSGGRGRAGGRGHSVGLQRLEEGRDRWSPPRCRSLALAGSASNPRERSTARAVRR